MTLLLKKVRDDPDNCREYYRDVRTGELFCTVDGKFHTCTDAGEPLAPLRKGVDIGIVAPWCRKK